MPRPLDYLLNKDGEEYGNANGWDVVIPAANELQLDIDTDAQWKRYKDNVKLLKQFFDVVEQDVTTSPGGNRHVYLRLNRGLTPVERIALQACLGSDPKREILSILRVFYQSDKPATMLYEKKR